MSNCHLHFLPAQFTVEVKKNPKNKKTENKKLPRVKMEQGTLDKNEKSKIHFWDSILAFINTLEKSSIAIKLLKEKPIWLASIKSFLT